MELAVYCLLALAPIATVFLLLVVARRSAKQAMPIAYLVTSLLALLIWRVPVKVVAASTLQGLVMAAEILYIIFGAILLLNILRESGAIVTALQGITGYFSRQAHSGNYHCLVIWRFSRRCFWLWYSSCGL